MKILILYMEQDNLTELAITYKKILSKEGHTVLVENIKKYNYAEELIPKLESFLPDFGITLNFAGMNLLTTGGDSLLTRLLCPFAHEIFMAPYYINHYLSNRFIFNNILYVHNYSDMEYIKKYYIDVPMVSCIPTPDIGKTLNNPNATSQEILSEINSLPDVYSELCASLISSLFQNPSAIFCDLVIEQVKQKGIGSLTLEEEKDLITLCSLSWEYCRSRGCIPVTKSLQPKAVLDHFIKNANFPSSNPQATN